MISLKKQSKGFTIVELLIVIVVIGILAGLVITTYNGIQQKARNTERTTDLKTFQSQLEAFYASNGRYPSTADLGATGSSNLTFVAANLKGMDKETLSDPKANPHDYSLATASTVNKYAYAPVNASGAACDDTGTNDCVKYVLTAQKEGGTSPADDIIFDSLN